MKSKKRRKLAKKLLKISKGLLWTLDQSVCQGVSIDAPAYMHAALKGIRAAKRMGGG